MLKRLWYCSVAIALFLTVGPHKTCAQQQQQSQQVPVTPVSPAHNSESQNNQNSAPQKAPEAHAGIEWSNWALVVIGGVTALAVWRTLGTIKRQTDVMETQANEMALQHGEMEKQAGYMRDQTETLKDSVKAAQKSADAAFAQIEMVKNRERGRLRIEFGKPDLVNDPDPENGYELPFSVTLDGATQVYITESSCFVGIDKSGDPVGEPWWNSMALPKTITPEDRIYKGSVTILTNEKPWGEPFTGTDETRVALVREEKLHVFARGVITYGDLFGNEWELRFNGKWKYYWEFPPTSIDLTAGYWESIGDNGEYKAEKQHHDPN